MLKYTDTARIFLEWISIAAHLSTTIGRHCFLWPKIDVEISIYRGRLQNILLKITFVPGSSILHPAMAMEVLGGREDPRTHVGPGHRNLLRDREETEEEVDAGLSVG